MAVNNSPNMNLPVPAVGIEPGPDWANDINNSLTIIDGHTHGPGSGVQITPTGLNINANLPFNNNNATSLQSVVFTSQALALTTLTAVYVVGKELFYTDGAGNNVQITSNGSVVGTPGSITGLTPPASVTYSSSTFIFQSNVNVAANLDAASILLRNTTASSPALTLSPPSSMSSNYTITLPTLPASSLPVVMSASGNLSAQQLSLNQLVAAVQQALNPAGSILAYGGAAAPSGYLLCDGSTVSRTTFASLFAAIGSAYGAGDGSTTFNIPDLRGMFLRGVTGASANDPDASTRTALNAGGNTGNNVGSKELDAFQGHEHTTTASSSNSNFAGGILSSAALYDLNGITSDIRPDGISGTPRISSETRPLNVYVTYIIKT